MKDVVWLVFTRQKVVRMTMTQPELGKGEFPLKLEVTVDQAAFREPTLVRQVHVADWRQGVDVGDVRLREGVITEAEAELIRKQRLAALIAMLEEQGFKIEPPPPARPDDEADGG